MCVSQALVQLKELEETVEALRSENQSTEQVELSHFHNTHVCWFRGEVKNSSKETRNESASLCVFFLFLRS